jgi:hypothetical protein
MHAVACDCCCSFRLKDPFQQAKTDEQYSTKRTEPGAKNLQIKEISLKQTRKIRF